MEIQIPFKPEFEDRMKLGLKTATSRPKRYGRRGDWFYAFGLIFTIVNVRILYLGTIASLYYKYEGFKTREEFMKMWAKLHPRIGFQIDRRVYFHEFTFARNALEYHVHELLANRVCQICEIVGAPTD